MRYRFRYNVGPMYMDSPFAGRPGLLGRLLGLIWFIVAFVLQLVVWVVLLIVGAVYTLVWLLVLPFHWLFGRRATPPP